MNTRTTTFVLLAAALVLPIAVLLCFTVGYLLTAMGDAAGGAVVLRVALALGIAWGLAMLILPIVLAIRAVADPPRAEEEEIE